MLVAIEEEEFRKMISTVSELKEVITNRKLSDVFSEVFEPEGAANYLKISRRYLDLLKAKKEIAFSQDGKVVRYKKSSLDAWLDSREIKSR